MAIATDMAAGRRRWRLVGQNAGAQIVSRVVTGLCQLALVPLLLHSLGTETFGWAMALVAFVAISQFADLGVAMALQHELSVAWARPDPAATRRTYLSGTRLLVWLGAGWLVLALPAAWWLGGRALVVATGVGEAEAKLCWLAVALSACAGVPLSAGPRLAAALQLGWISAAWTAAGSVATLGAACALAWMNCTGPLPFVGLLCASQLAPGWLTALHLARRLDWREALTADATEMRRLWRAGLPFAAPNLAGAVLQAMTPTAFARFGGYEASAAFAVLQRLFGVAQQGHALILGPLWPAYAEAAARGDDAWVRRTLRLSLALTAVAGAGVALATAALPWILPVWLGPHAPALTVAFAGFVAAWVMASMLVQALSFFLLGLDRLRRIAVPLALVQGLTLAAMAVFGKYFGGSGVAAAVAGGAALGLVPLLVRECAAARSKKTPAPARP